MDFRLTDEQAALRDAARSLLAAECPPSLARACYDRPGVVPDRLLRALREQGWLTLLAPDSDGGLGLGVVELCLLMEEAGRALVPAPLWSTAGLYVPTVLACADEGQRRDLLAPLDAGESGTVAAAEEAGRWAAVPATQAAETAAGWRLSGTKRLVPEAELATTLLVTATAPDGTGVFAVDRGSVTCRRVETLDQTRSLYDVDLTAAPATRLAHGDAVAVGRAFEVAAVSLAAELVGAARWLLDTTVAYAKVREQFDAPIGSFQAVQHLLADDLLDLERATAGVYWAAMCIDADSAGDADDRSRAAAVAKASAGDAARRVAKDGIQIHGGIGYTWEHDLHLYIRRIYAGQALLGDAEEHRARLADLLAL